MTVKSFREFCKEEYNLKMEDRKKETQRRFAGTFGTVPEDIRDGKVYIDNLIFEHELSFSGWLWKLYILCEKCNTYYDAGYVTSPESVYEKTIEKHESCKGKFKWHRIKNDKNHR